MKKKFWGYVPLDEQDFKEIWEDSKIVLDTNILLNLYRYSESTQKEVLRILEEKKEQFIIPDIVVKEFFDNRDKEIVKHSSIRDTVYNDMQINKMRDAIKKYRHLSLDTEELLKIIDEFEQKIDELLQKCETQDFFKDDPVLKKLVEWFDNRLIDNFEKQELEKIYEEGEKRFALKIPPGYKDANKKEGNKKYNDLIIWKQMIKYALENKTNILFVSDDLKEDWIKEINGEKKGPREELLNEFYTETGGQKIYIYSTTAFLNAYSEYNKTTEKVGTRTMHEVEEIEKEHLRRIDIDLNDNMYLNNNKKYYLDHTNDKLSRDYESANTSNVSFNYENKILLDKSVQDIIKELRFLRNKYLNDDDFCFNHENYKKLSSMESRLRFLYIQAAKYGDTRNIHLIETLLNDIKIIKDEVIPF